MEFWVVFKSDGSEDYVLLDTASTMAEAMEKRALGGDLIYRSDGRIVKDIPWADGVYALRCIKEDRPLRREIRRAIPTLRRVLCL